ncbi:NAD-P-binding protein [Mycena olivaceomarginata]|nr:NAD-P-binding protein [Mycena olivaceomarginata]
MSIPSFSSTTTAEEVANAFSAEIKGKNVLVTGTSVGGIGFETALAIAKYANLLIITGYNQERLKLSEEAIKKEHPHANVYCLVLNLSSLASVRKAAAEINALSEPLHVLINNAASSWGDFKLTEDGLERQYATNHVGPFLFTKLLIPKLLAAASPAYTPRVVFVSSVGHTHGSGVDFDALTAPNAAKFAIREAYRGTKSANILTTIELCKRSKGKINAYSLNPGLVYTNAFNNETATAIFTGAGFLDQDGRPNVAHAWKTIPQGASTTVTAAFDPRLNDKPGAYLDDCVVANEKIAPHSSDPANAEKLWDLTEKIIGEKFTF